MQHTITPRERWLARICIGYVLLVAVWLMLRAVFFDRLWWLALLNTFALALFLPLAALLPLALWRRRSRLLAALALPLAAFGWLFGSLLLPRTAPPEPAGPAFTVMSFNVLWSNQDYGRIAAAIETASPDIVALQELRPEHLPAIQEALGAAYPYQAVAVLPTERYHTVGLLSRFPIEEVTSLADPPLTDTSEAYAALQAGLVDSFGEAGWGFGYTMLAPWFAIPAQRLDYIWHTPELLALEAQVGLDGGSDHLPVVARLAWR